MGAKTGTAQVNQIDLENNGWFVCFAPLDNPKVAIVVYVPHGYSRCHVFLRREGLPELDFPGMGQE